MDIKPESRKLKKARRALGPALPLDTIVCSDHLWAMAAAYVTGSENLQCSLMVAKHLMTLIFIRYSLKSL